jgi:hypothetical protein
MRTVNNQGDGKLFGREEFRYEPDSDTYVCPGGKRLLRKNTNYKDRYIMTLPAQNVSLSKLF